MHEQFLGGFEDLGLGFEEEERAAGEKRRRKRKVSQNE